MTDWKDSDLDRLRAEVEALKTDIATYVRISSEQATENESLRAENAALREALHLIESAICSDARSVIIARAALQGAKDD